MIYKVEYTAKRSKVCEDTILCDNPEAVANMLQPIIGDEIVEKFVVVLVNAKGKVINYSIASSGGIASSDASPRLVFGPAILSGAYAVIVAHNHPSGDTTPSSADIDSTRRLVGAGEMLGIPVLDHLIITDSDYFSFKAHNLM